MKRFALPVALVLLLVATAVALAAPGWDLSWHAFTGGGARTAAGVFVLHDSVGQAVAGWTAARGLATCAGFWCRPRAVYDAYMPVIVRS